MAWTTNPFTELERMRREMDRIFSRVPYFGTASSAYPATNVYETGDDLYVIAELPGVKKEDINLNLHETNLIITGKRDVRQYGKSDLLRREQPEGQFEKTVRLPAKIHGERVSAKFEDGLLRINLPKSEESKPRQINVEM
ncbi:MAG: Hsp20/alpha crystallin family protein [Chitinispirillaceae bacterium]